MSDTEHALRAAIEADPEADAARMVYADWLIERGDPRGELIQIQCARRADTWWAGARLARREQRLLAQFQRPRESSRSLFDRGEEGWDFEVGAHATLAPRRWLRPRIGKSAGPAPARVAPFLASELFANVRRLDLREWFDWTKALDSSARPRHVLLPKVAGLFVEVLREAPLLERVTHLELHASFGDAQLARLMTAPWVTNLEQLSIAGESGAALAVTDHAIEAIAKARLPRLRGLDLRHARVTARGIEQLAATSSPLESVLLHADSLGSDGFEALHRSRLASITRPSLGGRASIDSLLALVRSPTWDGELALTSMHPTDTQNVIEREHAALDALARVTDARRLRALSAFVPGARFFESGFARSLEHLSTRASPLELGAASLRLTSLWTGTITSSDLAAPALATIERLTFEYAFGEAVLALAGSALRPLDLEIRGPGTTAATIELVRSPVLERVVDLTLALEGNLGSKLVTKALVETPYLQQVQRLELDFLTKFPAFQRTQVEARYGAAVHPRFVRS